jgi:hypothetical protein
MACPASIRESANAPLRPPSIWARTGTAVAKIAELRLQGDRPLDEYVGETVQGVEFTESDVEPLRVYIDHIAKLLVPRSAIGIPEARVSVEALWPGLYGHADYVVFDPPELHITDLKWGEGVFVDAIDNPQLMIYALGALLEYDRKAEVTQVRMHVVQPRYAGTEPVRSFSLTTSSLWHWAITRLLPALRATEAPDAIYNPGDHCRFCPAQPTCPALRDLALQEAQVDFAKAETLDNVEVAAVLDKAEIVQGWINAVKNEALRRAQTGQDIPGYVLTTGRVTREWALPDDEITKQLLVYLHASEVVETKLRSPAQIEKRLSKEHRGKLADLITLKPGGAKLVRDDGRAPLSSLVATDFVPAFLS